MSTDRTTQFGFTFGAMDVTRLGSFDDGRTVLRVETGYGCIDIYASPTGRSLRAFRDGEELKAPAVSSPPRQEG